MSLTGEPDPELTEDEQLMLDVGWLDLWHVEREAGQAADESDDRD